MPELFPALARWLDARREDGVEIDPLRLARLDELAGFLQENRDRPASLVFVCTHNSRRSQLAQAIAGAWAVVAGLDQLQLASAGTEITACHPNALGSLQRAGFRHEREPGAGDNPRHQLHLGQALPGPVLYSKLLEEALAGPAPRAAIMVCSSADAGCPVVPGADLRLALPFEDPKRADGSPREPRAYDRCRDEIASELAIAFAGPPG